MSWAFVLMPGIPYYISMGNRERRAIPSTSCLLIAVLKVCQKLSKEEFAACLAPAANEVTVSSRTIDRLVIFFIVVQSAPNTKTKGAFWRCSIDSWLLLSAW